MRLSILCYNAFFEGFMVFWLFVAFIIIVVFLLLMSAKNEREMHPVSELIHISAVFWAFAFALFLSLNASDFFKTLALSYTRTALRSRA